MFSLRNHDRNFVSHRWQVGLAAFAAVSFGGISIASACEMSGGPMKRARSTSNGCPVPTLKSSDLIVRKQAFTVGKSGMIIATPLAASAGLPVSVEPVATSPTSTSSATGQSDAISGALSFLNDAGVDIGGIVTTLSDFGVTPDKLVSLMGETTESSGGGDPVSAVTSVVGSVLGGAAAPAAGTGSMDAQTVMDALQKGGVSLTDLLTALQAQGLNPLMLESVLTPGGPEKLDAATVAKLQAAVASAAAKSGHTTADVVKALQAAGVDSSVIAVLGSGGTPTTPTTGKPTTTTATPTTVTTAAPAAGTGSMDAQTVMDALQKGGVSLTDLLTALQAQGLNPLMLESVLTPGGPEKLDAATVTKLQAAVASAAAKSGHTTADVVKALQAAGVDQSVIAVLGSSGTSTTPTTVKPTPTTTTTTAKPTVTTPKPTTTTTTTVKPTTTTMLSESTTTTAASNATTSKSHSKAKKSRKNRQSRCASTTTSTSTSSTTMPTTTTPPRSSTTAVPKTTLPPVATTVAPTIPAKPTTTTTVCAAPAAGTGSMDAQTVMDALQKGGVSLTDLLTALQAQGLNPLMLESVLTPGGPEKLDAATVKKLQAAVASAAAKSGHTTADVVKALQAAGVDQSVIAVLGSGGSCSSI